MVFLLGVLFSFWIRVADTRPIHDEWEGVRRRLDRVVVLLVTVTGFGWLPVNGQLQT